MGLIEFSLCLPKWVEDYTRAGQSVLATAEERMAFAVELSRCNAEKGTGGPFGACIFERTSAKLISVGVNVVISSKCSVAHAEIMAISLAQKNLGRCDLGANGKSYELVTSVEPCAMCLGAICWSGVDSVVSGARDEDARGIGFDEGPKVTDWTAALKDRGISVTRDVCRDEAKAVLLRYRDAGGVIY